MKLNCSFGKRLSAQAAEVPVDGRSEWIEMGLIPPPDSGPRAFANVPLQNRSRQRWAPSLLVGYGQVVPANPDTKSATFGVPHPVASSQPVFALKPTGVPTNWLLPTVMSWNPAAASE